MKFWVVIYSLFLAQLSSAQVYSSFNCSKDTIEIGDEVTLYYKLAVSNPQSVQSINFTSLDTLRSKVSLSAFTNIGETDDIQIADKDLEASFKKAPKNTFLKNEIPFQKYNRQFEYRDTFTLRIWDMGFYVIPHPEILIDSSVAVQEILEVQSPTILVTPTMAVTNPDTTQMILPINNIIVTPSSWKDYIWYITIPIVILLILAVILYLFLTKDKKKSTTIIVEKPKDPAHVIALSKLTDIKNQESWKAGKVKEYQSALTYTIREYLENRFNINALEQTTNQIEKSLKKNNLSQDHLSDVSKILQIADLVKFAKAKPSEDINATFLDKAFSFVNDTKKVESAEPSKPLENG